MPRVRVGSLQDLKTSGVLTGKVGTLPVCVFASGDELFAVDDRCPHMGFPLHRGSVENGLLTCHWHHARFDLCSGGTLDPFADDVGTHDVEVVGDDVFVVARADLSGPDRYLHRLHEGLEQGLTLVIAKSLLGLIETLGPEKGAKSAFRAGVDFGIANREEGWGSGLTVLTAMANVLPHLQEQDRAALALVHGLVFVARDTAGSPPRFALSALQTSTMQDRLTEWYRRFIDTRNGDASERILTTAISAGASSSDAVAMMTSAVTDHVFIDGGHAIDFTNKAFEAVEALGWDSATTVLPTLAHETARASRAEESGEWRHPHDLANLLESLPVASTESRGEYRDEAVDALAWSLLEDDPSVIIASLRDAAANGAAAEQLARAVAYAAALRLSRFHIQNDHSDWDVVHHGFTSANAIHQLVRRAPTPELQRGIYQVALKVYLDRFLNIPAARLPDEQPDGGPFELSALQECWDQEGMVDRAGAIVYRWLRNGGSQSDVVAVLGSALLAEDAEFHWFQTFEAAVRQVAQWPEGSVQAALILVGTARFLAAHTPTRRELSQVVRIATRLRRGDALFEED